MRGRWALRLAVADAILRVAPAIDPADRAAWARENALVAVFVPTVAVSGWTFRLSRLSDTLTALFLALHVVGVHSPTPCCPDDD